MLKLAEVDSYLFVEELGKCEHCGELFANLPPLGGGIRGNDCPQCGGELTASSFGYVLTAKGFVRSHWVGPAGEWVSEKPNRDFCLGDVLVVVNPPPIF